MKLPVPDVAKADYLHRLVLYLSQPRRKASRVRLDSPLLRG
jgi:hypothetical protein